MYSDNAQLIRVAIVKTATKTLECITKIHVQKDASSITCPSCNHLTPLPVEGVASLPLNIRFKEDARQDKLLQRIISSSPVCDSCEEDSSVSVAYFKDCDDLLSGMLGYTPKKASP